MIAPISHDASRRRCDCQTAQWTDDAQACVIAPVVDGAGTPETFSSLDPRIEGGRSAAKRNVSVSDAASRQHRSASLPPERDTRALRRSVSAAFSLPGTVLPGRGQTGWPILAGSGLVLTRGLWPAFVRPASSPSIWAAPLSWGGRQTRGVPDLRLRVGGAGAASRTGLFSGPRPGDMPCGGTGCSTSERLMKRPSTSRTG